MKKLLLLGMWAVATCPALLGPLASYAWSIEPVRDDESTFFRRILSRPAIPEPRTPFVMIFHQGGHDTDPFELRTNGTMTLDHWQAVYRHVGHLYPYDLVQVGTPWSSSGFDVCCRAAMAMGREYGAGTMGLPTDSNQEPMLREKYADALGLGASYWFHDFEGHDYSDRAKAGFKKWCVDEVLAVRQQAGVAPPKVVSDWMIPDNPGRLIEWVRDTGLTHGNAIGVYEKL